MKLFYPKSHYDPKYRGHVFPLLKAYIKHKDYTDAQRIKDYSVSESDFQITENEDEADIIILPMSWWYYKKTNQFKIAVSFIKKMNTKGHTVWTHIPGDAELDFPNHLDIKVLVQQTYKSASNSNVMCYPAFIEDPLQTYFNQDTHTKRKHNAVPTVGFCGYANSNLWKALKFSVKTATKNFMYHINLKAEKPHRLVSSVYKRSVYLNALKNDKKVRTNFIIRNNYRAGLKNDTTKRQHQTTKEFYQNINTSDYVFCYRGAGNFSIRFYQTLAMGRIPIFVNTDCLLPFHNTINWRDHVIWIEETKPDIIAEVIAKYNANLSTETLNTICLNNRKLWESHFSLGSFFKQLFKAY